MTTISIPAWISYHLLLYALCTGLALGLLHEVFWPGKNVTRPLPVWGTQIVGVAVIWIGFTAFCVFELDSWTPPAILAVFIVFGGMFPLLMRAFRWLSEKLHKLRFLENTDA